MASNPISREQLINAATDAETLEAVANNAPGIVTSRLGRQIKTVSKVIADMDATTSTAIAAKDAAIVAKTAAEAARDLAAASQAAAGTSATNASTSATQAANSAAAAASGILGKQTKALLDADLAHAADKIAIVTNDPTASNNGYYIKQGASGAGSWLKSTYDYAALLEGRVTAAESDITNLELFNNEIRILFNGRISVDRTTNSITYPSGIAMRNGELYKSFSSATLSDLNSGADYHWFDYGALLTNPPTSPFKQTSGGTPIPAPNPLYCFLGTFYYDVYTSYFPFEYLDSSKIPFKLPNDVFNGNLNNNAEGVVFYGDSRPTSTDNAPIVAVSNTKLNDLGCFYAMQVSPGSPLRRNFVEVPFKQKGFTDVAFCYASVLVHSSDGTWDWAGSNGPYIYVVHKNATTGAESNAQAGTMTTYVDLGDNVRQYYIQFNLTAPVAGSFLNMFRLGFGAGAASTATFSITGFWISTSSDSIRPGKSVQKEDTQWPNWSAVSGLEVSEIRKDITSLESRAAELETPEAGTLESLARALLDPLHSVQIRLIGDSITWGSGASGLSPSSPRSHALTDPRNNLQSPTWANLLRDYLGKAYCDEADLIEENPLVTGSGYYQKVATLDPTNGDSRFRFRHPTTNKLLPWSMLTNEPRTGPFFGRIVDFSVNENYNAIVEFDMVGDNLKIVYAGQSAGTNRYCDVYVDGNLAGSWEYGAAVLWQQESPEFTFPFGKHTIQLKNRSTDGGNFRLEGIRVTKKIRVINDGIIGTWTGEWLPGGSLITGVSSADEFVFVQLGTNDRGQSSVPLDPIRTMDNLRTITKHLRDTLGKKPLLLACCAVTSEDPATYKYNQGDVARVIYDLGQELGVDVVDQYRATVQLKIDGTSYLADGLHPNDYGYRVMFENLRNQIEAARPR